MENDILKFESAFLAKNDLIKNDQKSITSSNDGLQMVPEVPKTDNFLRPVPKTDNFLRPVNR